MEHRKCSRFFKKSLVQFCLEGTSKFDITTITNISMGGIAFTATGKIPPSTVIQLKINLPYPSPPISAKGTVVRSEYQKGTIFLVSVRFVSISSQDLTQLRKWLEGR